MPRPRRAVAGWLTAATVALATVVVLQLTGGLADASGATGRTLQPGESVVTSAWVVAVQGPVKWVGVKWVG
ncbi:hypothetical protein [Microlunatus sp. Y2014]|uniref:hypothetical protein n=1 Tax=Microlunatus sp. Y2014 TaxID=3418488 RepID=UPI003DA6EA9A